VRRLFPCRRKHPGWIRFFAASWCRPTTLIMRWLCSDRRYGPIANYLLALKIVSNSCLPLWLRNRAAAAAVRWVQAVAARWRWALADYLTSSAHGPIRILAFSGVQRQPASLSMWSPLRWLVAAVDPVAAFGRLARYPGR